MPATLELDANDDWVIVGNHAMADHLDIHVDTLRMWRAKGLPYGRIGRANAYDVDVTRRWIDRQNAIRRGDL